MNWRTIIALLFPFAVLGCAPEPFARGRLPVLRAPDAKAMREKFAGAITDNFITDDTVIIHAPFHDIAVLAVVRIDRSAGTFEMVGLNQLGVQLFAVGGDQKTIVVRFAIPPLDQQHDLLVSIGQDVRRMYFDLLPSPAAKVEPRRTLVRFSERNDAGTLVYEMGGDPTVLLEKRQAGMFGTLWRVRYFDYTPVPGGLYPRGIVMDNGKYLYRIVVKNRDWQKQ